MYSNDLLFFFFSLPSNEANFQKLINLGIVSSRRRDGLRRSEGSIRSRGWLNLLFHIRDDYQSRTRTNDITWATCEWVGVTAGGHSVDLRPKNYEANYGVSKLRSVSSWPFIFSGVHRLLMLIVFYPECHNSVAPGKSEGTFVLHPG